MFGFTEAFSLLLALSGLGVDANPNAPSADVVLEYAVPDAEVFAHIDLVAVVPRNYAVLSGLHKHPLISTNPELRAMAQKMSTDVEGGRAMLKMMTGVDPVSDITSLTAFAKIKVGSDPDLLVVARGTFPADLIEKAAKLQGGATEMIDGRAAVAVDDMYLGRSKSGELVFGTKALVKARVGNAWKAPARSGHWTKLAETLNAKPFWVAGVRPSATMLKGFGDLGKNAIAEAVRDLDFAATALHHDGVSWLWMTKSAAGGVRAELASQGVMDLLRALQIGPRGIGKIALAFLDSYKGHSKELDAVIKRKAELVKVWESFSGDGQFAINVVRKDKVVTARATGAKLSDVLPIGMVVPLAVLGFASGHQAEMPMIEPPASSRPVPVPPAPVKKTAPPASKAAPAKKAS